MNEISSKSAVDQLALLQSGEISAVELVNSNIRAIEKYNPVINALVTLDYEGSLSKALDVDQRRAKGKKLGPLAGLTVAVKDLFDTAGMRTTYGSRIFEHHVPSADHEHVKRLREADAIILGKSNTPEFAFGGQTENLIFGKTRNPWRFNKSPTGSSGGAAAALAAGMVSLADGSDFGGSVRTPASITNTVGFRPTSGLVPMYPNMMPYAYFNTAGPMARSVSDAALMMKVMSGGLVDDNDLNADFKKIRVAWNLPPFDYTLSVEVREVLDPHKDLFDHLCCYVSPEEPAIEKISQCHDFINYFCVQALTNSFTSDEQALLGSTMKTRGQPAQNYGAQDFLKNAAEIGVIWRTMEKFFQKHDLLVWPVMQSSTFDIDQEEGSINHDWRAMCLAPIANLPAISVPAGFSQDGMPVGLQIMAKPGNDQLVLQAAYAFEQSLGSHFTPPPLDRELKLHLMPGRLED